jgi:hypothetical protein
MAEAILANDDRPVTAHNLARETPSGELPRRIQELLNRRATGSGRRRAERQRWQAARMHAAGERSARSTAVYRVEAVDTRRATRSRAESFTV